MQKCSGNGCVKKFSCIRYHESKKRTKSRGRWVDADRCVNSEYDGDEVVKMPFDKLLKKGR